MADSSLEDDLLLAVGHTNGFRKGGKPTARRPRAPSPESDSSGDDSGGDEESQYHSEDEDEEDEEFEARKMNQPPPKKGPAGGAGSKMPLKKRFEVDRDGDELEESVGKGDESDALSFGSDLYYDSEDKEKLKKMKEFDREMELFRRSELRDAFLTRKREKEERRKQQQQSQKVATSRAALSGSQLKSGQKGGAKQALSQKETQKVEKQQRQEELRNMAQKKREKEAGVRSLRNKGLDEGGRGESSESDSESGRDSGSDDDVAARGGRESDDDIRGKLQQDADLGELRRIVVRRSKLAQWCYEPVFEEVLVGCLVRVSIGPNHMGVQTYRVCIVQSVETDLTRPYSVDGKRTTKYVEVKWGGSSRAWAMSMVSDKPATEQELREMCAEMDRLNLPPLSSEVVGGKAVALATSFQNIRYTQEMVHKIVTEKRAAQAVTQHWIVEKDRLEKEAAKAQRRGDEAEYERLGLKIAEVEERGRAGSVIKDERTKNLTRINQRNKTQNYITASAPATKTGEAIHDPFVRRWTRSQNYYRRPQSANGVATQPDDAEKGEIGAAPVGKALGSGGPEIDSAKESTNSVGGAQVKPKAPVDVVKPPVFLLDITLEPLERWGPPQEAFMARKRMLEATHGAPTAVSGEKRKSGLVYSVNDYKRRRGLI